MFKRISFSSAMMIGCASSVLANAGPAPAVAAPINTKELKSFETYAGIAGGAGFLKGKRQETSVVGNTTFPVPGSNKLHSKRGVYAFFFGTQYNVPNSKVFLALDPYISISDFKATTGGTTFGVIERSTINSRYAYGADFKAGVRVTDMDSVHMSIGTERRSFGFRFVDTAGTNASARKKLMAFNYGVGYEHSFGKIALGLNVKHQRYRKSSLNAASPLGGSINSMIKPNILTAMVTLKYKI